MHQHVDLVGGQRKQIGGFDDLEPLVHHRGGIDGDLLSHAPVRMFQRLRQRGPLDVGALPCPERPARGGDDDSNKLFAIAGAERLKQRVMFGIRRQNAGSRLGRALHEEVARAHQAFLVRKRDRGASIDRSEGGLQSRGTANGGHHPIRRTRRGLDDCTFARAAFDAGAGKGILQFAKAFGVGYRGKARAEFLCELGQRLNVGMRGERLDPVAVAGRPQQIHRAVADRPGGAQHGHDTDGGCRGLRFTQRNSAHTLTKP